VCNNNHPNLHHNQDLNPKSFPFRGNLKIKLIKCLNHVLINLYHSLDNNMLSKKHQCELTILEFQGSYGGKPLDEDLRKSIKGQATKGFEEAIVIKRYGFLEKI